ncbi:MAG: hypothetical protein RIR70_438 [Pseudomonadota bacterium]
MPTAAPHLTLIIPGLLWPAHSAAAVMAELPLPALSRLLTDAQITRRAPATADDFLLEAYGLNPANTARAGLRALGDGLDDEGLLCADPVALTFARESLILAGPESLEITPDEAAALIDALNAALPDTGRFIAPHPARWYWQAGNEHTPTPRTSPLADVLGRRIDNYLPHNPAWRRLMNEIQMVFHHHPVSAAREQCGAPRINSLWLWGDGARPALTEGPGMLADSTLAKGLARAAKRPIAPLPDRFPALTEGHTLALIDWAQHSALTQDIDPWREAASKIESHWLAPALDALQRKRLTLSLHLPGDTQSLTLACRKPWLRGLFSKPLPIPRFLESLQSP